MDDGIRTLDFGAGRRATAAGVRQPAGLTAALARLGLPGARPVVVVVGGAAGLDKDRSAVIEPALAEVLRPVVTGRRAIVLDGGTDSGVMRLMGRLRVAERPAFPLLGVAAEGTVTLPGEAGDGAALNADHSHFLLVPGDQWGDEAAWIAQAATALAGPAPSVTLLINGGQLAYADVRHSLAERRPVLVLSGTGRTADRIAAAVRGDTSDALAAGIAGSPRVHIVPAGDAEAFRCQLSALLGR